MATSPIISIHLATSSSSSSGDHSQSQSRGRSQDRSMQTDELQRRIIRRRYYQNSGGSPGPDFPMSGSVDQQILAQQQVVYYSRVSTLSQDTDGGVNGQSNFSQETQKNMCAEFLDKLEERTGRKIRRIGWFSYIGSAFRDRRVYLTMLKREILRYKAQNHLEKLVVMVRDASRFSRHGKFAVALVIDLLDRHNVRVFSLAQGDFLDSQVGINALLQAYEDSRIKSSLAKAARQKAQRRGDDTGRIPYGFRRDYDPVQGRRRNVEDASKVPIIRFIQLCATYNTTVAQIWDRLKMITPIRDTEGIGTILDGLIVDEPNSNLDPDSIAEILNAYQVPYKNNRPWKAQIISQVLENFPVRQPENVVVQEDPDGEEDADEEDDEDEENEEEERSNRSRSRRRSRSRSPLNKKRSEEKERRREREKKEKKGGKEKRTRGRSLTRSRDSEELMNEFGRMSCK